MQGLRKPKTKEDQESTEFYYYSYIAVIGLFLFSTAATEAS